MPSVKSFLDRAVQHFNQPDFIAHDPIAAPHRFSKKQDREIIGFLAAMLAWGQRSTILKNALRLSEWMDNAPHDFIQNHQEIDRQRFLHFKHRTFQPTDTLYFLERLQQFYLQSDSLELAFARHLSPADPHIEPALRGFHRDFFDHPFAPARTRKHVSTPARGSACKRLCMFLRWMVRRDNRGVDFGIWQRISPAQLVIPLDVHVERVARRLGLFKPVPNRWKAALALTHTLKQFDPDDPVKYDFALFGLSITRGGFEEFTR